MILTYKTQVYPSREQEQVLWDLSEQCRLLYNFALTERKVIWEQERNNPYRQFAALLSVDTKGNLVTFDFELVGARYITYQEQQNALPALKNRYPKYHWVYSKLLQMVLKTLDADFKSFVSLKRKGDTTARSPKYKGKKHFVTLKYNQSGFKVEDGFLKLSHKHPSGLGLVFKLSYLPVGLVKQVEFFYDTRTNKWFVVFNCYIQPLKYYDNGLYQAFDSGIDNIVAAFNSQSKFLKIKNRQPDKYWKKKIAEVQSKRDRCIKFSRKWKWYHQKLYQMIRKLHNQLKDFHHWLSQKLVKNTKANTLIFGKPTIKKMAQTSNTNTYNKKATKTLHFSLQNTGTIARFIQYVTYKAQRAGKLVIPIDESFTTLICPLCGILEYKPLSQRNIACRHCGYTNDRDLASAINILAKFYILKPSFSTKGYILWHEPSVNEESFFLKWKGFLRQTAKGKTKIPLTYFWSRFGGLAGKISSPSFPWERGLTPKVYNRMEIMSFRTW